MSPSPIKSVFVALLLGYASSAYSGIYLDAVKELGFSELAATFSPEKVEQLTGAKVSSETATELQALAVLTLLDAPREASALNHFVQQFTHADIAYLGELDEASVYQRVETVWLKTTTPERSPFAIALREVIGQGIATGYNIYTTPWPAFAKERHLVYGHNDIDHAQQLLALLASEGLQAKVGFSFKTSAFLYRDDWGVLDHPTIDLGKNRRLIEAREFDLHFEFPSANDKQRFMQVINRYAKKDRADQTGLIRSAWWQPYYRSLVVAPDFQPVTQILVSDGSETAVLLALADKAPALVKEILALGKGWQVTPETIWVNPAFYRYLQGGYK